MMAFSALVEPLRAANQISGRELYSWNLVSADDAPIRASNGFELTPTRRFDHDPEVDRVVVCSGGDAERLFAREAIGWIRGQLRRGADIGAVADAAFVLARAGLLDGYRCTLHWTSQPAFSETFPKVLLERSLFVIDRDRFTSLGGVGSLDMQLAMIERDYSLELAHAVADWFAHATLRTPDARRQMPLNLRRGIRNRLVLACVAEIEARPDMPFSVAELAARQRVSPDTLERAFRIELGQPPGQFFRGLRLRHGRSLIEHSDMPIREVALACGYADQAAFSRAFRSKFGVAPVEVRAGVTVLR
ncbi:GlxA family transcriptional regulator [Pseudoruegeria sp. HB172150]|uniref:GlxA family transcriptional regulator n=1 Tax=Pseudoruegeria sp. HB172150 TaxID=2721164 RepID=UPI001C1326C6|nr:GlxA family transcriptional regulator [Pseudoruegeria sp. HB172150]